jgi:hypothetical protein
MEFIGGIAVGMFIMCIVVAQLEKRENKKNYYIVYNDVTDEYELVDYSKCRWENNVIFKSNKKELVEAKHKLIIERREGTPKKLSKSPEKVSKFRCLG